MAESRWKVLSSRYLTRAWWMSIREDTVRTPSGQTLDAYHVLEVPDWVCVLAITKAQKVVLVRQYRHGIGESNLELPAGAVDGDELTLNAAKRELAEETGYTADHWKFVASLHQDPSRQTNKAHVFVATGATFVQPPQLDPAESISVELIDCRLLKGMVDSAEIRHSTHVAGILLAMNDPEIRDMLS